MAAVRLAMSIMMAAMGRAVVAGQASAVMRSRTMRLESVVLASESEVSILLQHDEFMLDSALRLQLIVHLTRAVLSRAVR
jgi:hypothetical protein